MHSTTLKILAISPSPGESRPLPENLAQLATAGLLQIDSAPTFHAAAAALVLAKPAYDALLVDAEVLARRHVQMLRLINRHTSLPLWYLPSTRGYGPSSEAFPPGALPADHAVRALQDSRTHASTQPPVEGNSKNAEAAQMAPLPPHPPALPSSAASPPSKRPPRPAPGPAAIAAAARPLADSENSPPDSPEKRTEIPVAEELAPGYDPTDGASDQTPANPRNGPLLSAPELRALLGTSD